MDRFWNKVAIASEDECWPWLGSRRRTGHGQFRLDGKLHSAHAISLTLSGKPKPDAFSHALHSCDNPSCCNPRHLRWGTALENIADMVKRDRGHKMPGESNPQSLLSEVQVLEIFAQRARLGERGALAQIGRKYGVSYTTVRDIWQGYSWSSVTGLTSTRHKHIKATAQLR